MIAVTLFSVAAILAAFGSPVSVLFFISGIIALAFWFKGFCSRIDTDKLHDGKAPAEEEDDDDRDTITDCIYSADIRSQSVYGGAFYDSDDVVKSDSFGYNDPFKE